MSEERTLVANLVPKISQSDISKFVQDLQNELGSTSINVNGGGTSPNNQGAAPASPSTPTEVEKAFVESAEARKEAESAQAEAVVGLEDAMKDVVENSDDTSSTLKDMSTNVLSSIAEMAQIGFGATRMVLDYVEKFWKRLEAASPALKNVMNMIDNAVNLFLMPIGTAIAMELVPLVTNLYENVFEVQQMMWDAYEEGGISGMIKIGLEYALPVLLEFARDAWELIPDDIPVISDIKDFVSTIMDWFIDNKEGIANVVDTILDVSTIIVTNLKLVISAVAGFATAYFVAKAADFEIFGTKWGGVSAATGLAAFATTYGGMSYIENKATGGDIDPIPGGRLVRVGEGGEREHIVPESKIPQFVSQHAGYGSSSYTINFYGVTEQEFINKVEDIVNQRTSLATLRGGF